MRLYALFMYALCRANILVLIYCCLRTKVDINTPLTISWILTSTSLHPSHLSSWSWPLKLLTPRLPNPRPLDLSNFRPFKPLTPLPFHPSNSLTPHSFISSLFHLFDPFIPLSLHSWPLDPMIPWSHDPWTPWPLDPLTPRPLELLTPWNRDPLTP